MNQMVEVSLQDGTHNTPPLFVLNTTLKRTDLCKVYIVWSALCDLRTSHERHCSFHLAHSWLSFGKPVSVSWHTSSLVQRSILVETDWERPPLSVNTDSWAMSVSYLGTGSSSPSWAFLVSQSPSQQSWLQPHKRLWVRTIQLKLLLNS